MREATGDLWTYPADIRVITTNASVKKNGEAVMGRGCAKEAAERYPGIARKLSRHLRLYGNSVCHLTEDLYTLPVKYDWRNRGNMELILQSVQDIQYIIDERDKYSSAYSRVVMPRPGCGAGNLDWDEVKPLIEPYLDDRFTVITFPEVEDGVA